MGCAISTQSNLIAGILRGTCNVPGANYYPLDVAITASPLTGTSPLLVDFTASARDIDGTPSYQWNFGDGNTGTGAMASHTYESAGDYLVTMVVTDDDGAMVPVQTLIQVGGNLAPTANAGTNIRARLREQTALNGTSSSDPESDSLSYSWELSSKPEGSMAILAKPNTARPFFAPDVVGDYRFSLTVNDGELSSTTDTVTVTAFIAANAAPTLNSIGNKTVVLGSELKFTVTGSDGDSDSLSFRSLPSPLLPNARFNGRTGEFIFRPQRDQVGTHELTFSVFDGKAFSRETVTITVTAPTTQVTGLTGRVLDTNAMAGSSQEIAISAATVSILLNNISVATARTNAQGYFSLASIPDATSHVLKIDVSTASPGPGGVRYADFIEPLQLIQGVSNVISRPFFLPRIDISSATNVVAGHMTTVSNTNLEVELDIPADAVVNDDGTTFTGSITVSQVPRNLAPVSLPEQFNPSMLITIQPAGILFSTPAQISFPNSDALPSGAEVDIYSIDPDSGVFVVTGRGRVSTDGAKIETISGGIRGATWHFPSPPPPDPDIDMSNTDNADCANWECGNVGSSSPLAEGFLLESHNLVTYRSLGQTRGLRLSYSSNGAAPMPIIKADATLPLLSIPLYVSARLRIGGEEKAAHLFTDSGHLVGNIRRVLRQKVFYDASDLNTGLYAYELLITSHYPGSSVTGILEGKTMVVNQRDSTFGVGWSLESHHRPYVDGDGDVLLRFGNSDLKRFAKQEDGTFLSPQADYSTLQSMDGGYVRTLKDGTRYIFDSRGLLQQIKDRNNNITLYCYDESNGRLKYIEDPVGNRTHFAHSGGKVISITDPANRVTRLTYDEQGNLVSITNPDGSTRSFQYDSEHKLVGQQRENGKISNYVYNSLGRLERSIESGGVSTAVETTAIKGLEGLMEGGGSQLRPLAVLESVNEEGAIVDKNGHRTRLWANEFGALTSRVNALGDSTQIDRDDNNNPTTVTDAAGRVTVNEFDSMGNLISRTDRVTGAVTRYTYESRFNRVSSIQNPKGDRTQLEYDSRGNLTRITDANNRVSAYTYNAAGQLETQTDFLGNVNQFFYDNKSGHLIASRDPQGHITRFTYGVSGNVLTSTDAEGNVTTFDYDAMNRVTKTIDAKMGETLFSYDVSGNIIGVTDAGGNITTFTYDEENRLSTKRDPLEREEHYSYDNVGNLIEQINRKGGSIVFEYDALNRPVRKVLGREVLTYTYDAVGNLVNLTDRDSNIAYSYNSRNQVVSVSTEGSPTQPSTRITYNYDLNGNRIGMSTPFGDVTYSYDNLNRQTGLSHGERSFAFSYDEASRLVRRSYPNGAYTQYSYDRASRLLRINHQNHNGTLAGFSYAYDKAGNRIQKDVNRPTLSLSGEVKYTYDKLNQLISATNPRPAMPMERFTYDGVGNRLQRDGESEDSVFNANNQLLDDKAYTYEYDLNGNLAQKQHKTSGKLTIYDWDRENRLVEISEHPNSMKAASKKSFTAMTDWDVELKPESVREIL